MPSIAVHLTIAARLERTLGISDLPSYYLGNIAPDSVNADGFAPSSVRYEAHVRKKELSEWKKSVGNYRRLHQPEYADNADFFTGVMLHLYTDIAWDETVQPLMFDYLRSMGFAEEELNDRKWDELRGFDRKLSENDEYIFAIEQLRLAHPVAVTTVTPELMAKWQKKIIELKYPYPPSAFLNDEHIALAGERALKLLAEG